MRSRLVIALALFAGMNRPETARAKEKRPSPVPPVFGSSVTVVTVPVFVRGKDGETPSGLKAADFEVTDEGKVVNVVGLQEIDASQPLPELSSRTAAAARRQFMLLFDFSFTSPSGLLRAREAATDFVKNGLGPSDLAAVATLSVRTGLNLVVGFTSDRAQLAQAVDSMGSRDLDRKRDPLGLIYSFAPLAEAPGKEGGKAAKEDALAEEIRQSQVLFKKQDDAGYRRDVGGLLKGMTQLAQALDSAQGRKQIIYFSAGFDQTALVGERGEDAKASGESVVDGRLWEVDSENRFGDSGIRQQMQDMLRAFSGSDVVVHAIDITGLAARNESSSQGEEAVTSGREALSQIAVGTGGRFVRDQNDLRKALGEILETSRRYYVLAYEPEAVKGAGKFHKIKVRTLDKSLNVSHRSGWYEKAPEPQNALAGRLAAAETVAKGLSGGEIETRVLAVPYRSVEGKVTLPVVLEIDGKSLLARGSGALLRLEVYGYAIAADGAVEDAVSFSSTLQLDKVGAGIGEKGLQLQAAFTVPAGTHSLRFLVRDAEKGRRGFSSEEVTVPGFEPGNLVLYPPLFMDDPSKRLVLPAASRVTGGLPDMPFHLGDAFFTPKMQPHLSNGRTDSVCVMAFDGGARYESGAEFQIKAQLLDGDGTAVKIGRLSLAKSMAETDGFRRFVLSVTPADVPAGKYTFRIKLQDPTSGQVSQSDQTVRVD